MRRDFRPLPNKNVQIWDHLFPLLFPKDSKSLKNLDIQLREMGAKRRFNVTSKVNTRTDGHTHTQTFRLIKSIGPEGRCFDKSTQWSNVVLRHLLDKKSLQAWQRTWGRNRASLMFPWIYIKSIYCQIFWWYLNSITYCWFSDVSIVQKDMK